MLRSFEDIRKAISSKSDRKIAVAAAHDEQVLHAIDGSIKAGIASFMLFGSSEKIRSIALSNNYDLTGCQIIECDTDAQAAQFAVKAVSTGQAGALMKGNIQTAQILRAVLDKEYGLRTGRILSHVAVFEHNERLLLITDGGMIINPDLNKKIDIIKNALQITAALEIENPKIALLAAVETINPDMPCTIDAAALTVMNRRGQIKNCIIDGPLALDNALSADAALHKGIISDVAGTADILVAPNIESGNILAKSLTYIGGKRLAGLIVGARKPIVLTSRSDSYESKLNSIALAALAG